MIVLLFLLLAGCSDGGTASAPQSTQTTTSTQAPTPQPAAKPAPLVWEVSAPVAGGQLTGTFSYEVDAQPYATNAYGMAPNALYHLTDWHLVVSPTIVDPEPIVFDLAHTRTAMVCVGICLFDPRSFVTVILTTDTATLQLVWEPPVRALPLKNEDWGKWVGNGAFVRSNTTYMLMFSGTIQQVPGATIK